MITNFLLFCAFFAHGKIDATCFAKFCQVLTIETDGSVHYRERGLSTLFEDRDLVVGNIPNLGTLRIPTNEAAIRTVDSQSGWRVVVSVYLRHEERDVALRVRFYWRGRLKRVVDALPFAIDEISLRRSFDKDPGDLFTITSQAEHSYNLWTEVWLLRAGYTPKRLLAFGGCVDKYSLSSSDRPQGILTQREVYDGVTASTKGRVWEFWKWDRQTASLTSRRFLRDD